MTSKARCAVIGAGVSGLACARRLQDSGLDVILVDKSWRPGGRLASRRSDFGHFDHGAQYFTVRDPRFLQRVEAASDSGAIARWEGRIMKAAPGKTHEDTEPHPRFVGTPTMNDFAGFLAKGLECRTEFRVEKIERAAGEWQIQAAGGEILGPFDQLIIALPPAQATALLPPDSEPRKAASSVVMRPCIAVMAAFEERVASPFDGAFVENHLLSWVARDSSKPGREDGERWVLHASAEWSARAFDETDEFLIRAMANSFEDLVEAPLPDRSLSIAHRWRYSIPETPWPARWIRDEGLGVTMIGDWCGGPRVEGAWLSGFEAAEALLAP